MKEEIISDYNELFDNFIDIDRDSTKGIDSLLNKLYPICRSITGDGVRLTLKEIRRSIPLKIIEVKTGKKVFDWRVPDEWNIKDATLRDSKGKIIADLKKNNLHVLSYSEPVNKIVSYDELKEHLYTIEEYPDRIPYRTSYYDRNWGFCLSYKEYKKLKRGDYKVRIDSSLTKGYLTYGEYLIKGKSSKEFLISTYLCHPSLANDNLSGLVMSVYLAKYLTAIKKKLKYSYRFLFIPETIGAICWLAKNEQHVKRIKYGLVVTCVGDSGNFTYKKSRNPGYEINNIVEKVLYDSGKKYFLVDFFPSGSDERQFCSPGFDLPVGSLMRTSYGKFSEQHSSADNLEFISAENIFESLMMYIKVVFVAETNHVYLNTVMKCEPQLGKRNLYRKIGADVQKKVDERSIYWVLNLSDGGNSLIDISIKSGINYLMIRKAANMLQDVGLIVNKPLA